ncbi:MAG: acetolactate synthase small subunit [Nitrososphaeria archaeon]
MKKERVFFITVADKPGVLFKITNIFRRRNFNIESVTVGKTLAEDESQIIITINADEEEADSFARMVKRLIDVYEVVEAPKESCYVQELLLAKLEGDPDMLQKVAENYGAQLIKNGSLILKYVGEPANVEELIKELSNKFKIIHISRTGITAVVKEDGKDILRFGR